MKSKSKKWFFSSPAILIMVMTIFMAMCSNNGDDKTGPDPGTDGTDPSLNEYLPDWEEGYLDIHHIATGKGDVTFIICPDGTTMLIDAGDGGYTGAAAVPPLPDDSKTAGEWIADYIQHFSEKLAHPNTLDYVFITHIHGDHIGTVENAIGENNGYRLSGITMVGEFISMKKIIDRGWPDYNFPAREGGGFFNDYLTFLQYQEKDRDAVIEKFIVGSNSQFALKNKPASYTGFEVRNLYANGEVWTGSGTGKRTLYTASASPDENMHSCAIKMSYGPFAYFSGGDISGYNHAQYPSQVRDIETPVGEVTGKVTVLKANHHGWIDGTNLAFLNALTPEVIVILVNHRDHPHASTIDRTVDPLQYAGDPSWYITCLSDGHKRMLGARANIFKPDGHIVVRVYDGGTKYRIFVLDAKSKWSYPISYQSDEILLSSN